MVLPTITVPKIARKSVTVTELEVVLIDLSRISELLHDDYGAGAVTAHKAA